MTLSQLFAFVAVTIAAFVFLEWLLSKAWMTRDEKDIREWEKSQRTLAAHGVNEHAEFLNSLADLTGVRNADVRPQKRTLRGDVSRAWSRFRLITKTRF